MIDNGEFLKHDIKISDEINNLIKRHRLLDEEADKLSARRYLSQTERQELKTLKIRRLWAKDKLRILKSQEERDDESG